MVTTREVGVGDSVHDVGHFLCPSDERRPEGWEVPGDGRSRSERREGRTEFLDHGLVDSLRTGDAAQGVLAEVS